MGILNTILKSLKEEFAAKTGIVLDFRVHVFLDNQYGATPSYNYNIAEQVVPFVYDYLTNYLEENEGDYPKFGGWEYNTSMSIESLKTTRLKMFIEDKIQDMLNHKIDLKNIEIKFEGSDGYGEYGIHDGFFNAVAVIDGKEYDFQCCAEDGTVDFNDSGSNWGICGDANEKIADVLGGYENVEKLLMIAYKQYKQYKQ